MNRLTNASYSSGDNYAYTYDTVANRLSETSPAETNSYAYDIANRLTSVNGVFYTWDNNGNLLADGTKTYIYDLANRLTSVADGTHTYQYAYNGLGDRLQSTQDGVTTTYALDLNAGLTQALDDGVNTYVYGYTRLAQVSDTQTGYFLTDALGSVRHANFAPPSALREWGVTDAAGAITLVRDYSPYGETVQSLGSFETPYSYTGEMTDASGLVFLRARYREFCAPERHLRVGYDPATGRFVSRDTWEGEFDQPGTQNKWEYADDNPGNLIDPSGNISCDDENDCIDQQSELDYRDLTDWLYREMIHNASDPRIIRIREINRQFNLELSTGICIIGAGMIPEPVSAAAIIGGVAIIAGNVTQAGGGAIQLFKPLVQDHGPWDFKHEIRRLLGEGISLAGERNVEYSVPGNIHFGFVGSAAGYGDEILYLGAGFAEVTDPSHKNESAKENGVPYSPYNGSLSAYGDNSEDYRADRFGVQMYTLYEKGNLSLSRFGIELAENLTGFSHHDPAAWSINGEVAASWPYPVGYFNP